MKVKWIKGIPSEPGIYWMYCYRFGKKVCGRGAKPELVLLKVFEISNGLAMVADGHFVYKSEVEDPYYVVADLPINFPY